MSEEKIESTIDAWENRELGASEGSVKVSTFTPSDLEESLELQMISIRLQKSLIDKLKYIASRNGIGYQPLIKQILTRFTESEMKQIMRELVEQQEQDQQDIEESDKGNSSAA